MIRWLLVAAIIGIGASAQAQLLGVLGANTGGGAATSTACTAGAIDLSLTTGCNLLFFVGEVFP